MAEPPPDPSARPVAIVTGGSRGIGRACAVALGRTHNVVVGYRSAADQAQEVVDELTAAGGHAIGCAADLQDPVAAEHLVHAAVSAFGRLDAVVSNAGIYLVKPFVDVTADELAASMNINASSGFILAQAAARQMIAAGHGGSITFVTSSAGLRPRTGRSTYSISKAAETMMAQVLAKELGPSGIRVNAVAPGTIVTDINRELLATEEGRRRGLSNIVLGDFGKVEDVAEAVAFLTSDRAGFITGAVLTVDGGSALS